MSTQITFFPVANGDMTLIELDDKHQTKILIDINIRESADDDDERPFDAAGELKRRLKKDDKGRPYVDAFLQTHPDHDHLNGLMKHFHLGPVEDYADSKDKDEHKIIIYEIWSSPIVWRRADRRTNHTLCEDAKAFNTEAKRRVNLFREQKKIGGTGDRIRIIGEDENGNTDGLDTILARIDTTFTKVNERETGMIEINVLAPLPSLDDKNNEALLTKNHSSVILQLRIASQPGQAKNNWILCGGDAEVAIWRELWWKHQKDPSRLRYDILLTPHHCSWHSLSEDSWSKSPNPKVDYDARSALSQTNSKAILIASSNPIKNDKNDPPCWGAKQEYEDIGKNVGGSFLCTGTNDQQPIEIRLTSEGPQMSAKRAPNVTLGAGLASAAKPKAHG